VVQITNVPLFSYISHPSFLPRFRPLTAFPNPYPPTEEDGTNIASLNMYNNQAGKCFRQIGKFNPF
jgi:hypothetical protein